MRNSAWATALSEVGFVLVGCLVMISPIMVGGEQAWLDIELPEGSSKRGDTAIHSGVFELVITKNELLVAARSIDLEELSVLAGAAAAAGISVANVFADRRVYFERYTQVAAVLEEQGFRQIAVRVNTGR